MTIYFIDTARHGAWKDAFPSAIPVCTEARDDFWEISANDVVFAHTHEERVYNNPDLVLVSEKCDPVVIEFCQKVLKASEAGETPRIILYSGECIDGGQANYWKGIAISESGPFFGFPFDRIEVLGDAIPRHVEVGRLEVLVNAVLERLRISGPSIPANPIPLPTDEIETSGPATASGKASSFNVADQLDRNAEAVLAAHLIIDADKCGGDPSSVDCHGVSIIPPDTGLVDAAKQVIQAHLSRTPLDTSVQVFHSKLGVDSVP